MVAITRLKPTDTIDVDCSAVSALFRAHGAVMAEDILMGHVTELTDAISALDAQSQAHGHIPPAALVRDLSHRANTIGLTTLAQTLLAVARATDAGNWVAFPALWDRVKRIGDRSLVMLWDLPQLRM